MLSIVNNEKLGLTQEIKNQIKIQFQKFVSVLKI